MSYTQLDAAPDPRPTGLCTVTPLARHTLAEARTAAGRVAPGNERAYTRLLPEAVSRPCGALEAASKPPAGGPYSDADADTVPCRGGSSTTTGAWAGVVAQRAVTVGATMPTGYPSASRPGTSTGAGRATRPVTDTRGWNGDGCPM